MGALALTAVLTAAVAWAPANAGQVTGQRRGMARGTHRSPRRRKAVTRPRTPTWNGRQPPASPPRRWLPCPSHGPHGGWPWGTFSTTCRPACRREAGSPERSARSRTRQRDPVELVSATSVRSSPTPTRCRSTPTSSSAWPAPVRPTRTAAAGSSSSSPRTAPPAAFIQYWLILYSAPCPAGWQFTWRWDIHCYRNSPFGRGAQPADREPGQPRSPGTATPAATASPVRPGRRPIAGGNYVSAAAGGTSPSSTCSATAARDGGRATSTPARRSTSGPRTTMAAPPHPTVSSTGLHRRDQQHQLRAAAAARTGRRPAIVFNRRTRPAPRRPTARGHLHRRHPPGDLRRPVLRLPGRRRLRRGPAGTGFEVQARKVSGAPTGPTPRSTRRRRAGRAAPAWVVAGPKLYVNGARPPSLRPARPASRGRRQPQRQHLHIVNEAGDSMKATGQPHLRRPVGGPGHLADEGTRPARQPENDVTKLEAADGSVSTFRCRSTTCTGLRQELASVRKGLTPLRTLQRSHRNRQPVEAVLR